VVALAVASAAERVASVALVAAWVAAWAVLVGDWVA
jgi:hypothetical protein